MLDSFLLKLRENRFGQTHSSLQEAVKIIQGHRCRCQSKARMYIRLPNSDYY